MKKPKLNKQDLVSAAVVAAAASGALANTSSNDVLFDADDFTPSTSASAAIDIDVLVDWDSGADTNSRAGDPYLVAEQHDGTWVGGVGRDVISDGERPRRKLRDRLTTSNLAGGFALVAGFGYLVWSRVRRRRS